MQVDNPRLLKAARGLLGWSQHDVSVKSGIGRTTVSKMDHGQNVRLKTLRSVQRALEDGGIEFLVATEARGEGVRYRNPEGPALRG